MSDLADRQSASSRQGEAFEKTVEILLQIEGWQILERKWRHPVIDVEVDLVAKDADECEWWIECKGSWEGARKGLERTDTLKKAIANGALLSIQEDARPFMVVTSHMPRSGAGDKWVDEALTRYVDEFRTVGFVR